MLKLKLQYFATWCEELTHWKRPWCGERLKAGEEGDDRGWDGWMSSLTQWTWVWVNSGSWWWTGRPGVLQSKEVSKSRTWLSNWTELNLLGNLSILSTKWYNKVQENNKDDDDWQWRPLTRGYVTQGESGLMCHSQTQTVRCQGSEFTVPRFNKILLKERWGKHILHLPRKVFPRNRSSR